MLAPVLIGVFLTPFGQQLTLGGAHFFVFRIFAVVALLRVGLGRLLSKDPLFAGGFNGLDKLFFAWALLRGLAFILLFRETGAVVNQVGLWLDAFGGYILFRYALRDEEDISRISKVLAFVVLVLAACMFFESLTRIDVFSYLAGRTIVPWLRNGRVRAQAVFANSITAGTIGATLLPLFFWLWKSGKSRIWGLTGMASASVVAVTSMASTPITAWMAGILGLCLWPIRRLMRPVRWGLVFLVLGLALVMKAPVWFIITKVNFVGGDSWDRANLITQALAHFSNWWLIGTKDNANWGDFTWDQCNQYIAEGLQGGLLTMVLFIAILSLAFSRIGRCRKQTEGQASEWFYWSLGAALFAHLIDFLGIDYFDQTRTLWCLFVAILSVATYATLAEASSPAPAAAPFPRNYGGPVPQTAGGRMQPSLSRFAEGGDRTTRPPLATHCQQIRQLGGMALPRPPRSPKE